MSEGLPTEVVRWAISAVLMVLAMGAIRYHRKRTTSSTPSGELRHTKIVLVLGVVSFLFCTGLIVLPRVVENDTFTWWTDAVFGFFALCGAYIVVECWTVSHSFSEDGLEYRRLLRGGGFISWSDLVSVRYGHTAKWFRLETKDGRVARISAYMVGLPAFAQIVLKRTSLDVANTDTLQILRETAAGNPPRVW